MTARILLFLAAALFPGDLFRGILAEVAGNSGTIPQPATGAMNEALEFIQNPLKASPDGPMSNFLTCHAGPKT